MKGLSEEEYRHRFSRACDKVRAMGLHPVNPVEIGDALGEGRHYGEYLAHDLAIVERCSHIFMMDGWEVSNGANVEFYFAKLKGLIIIKDEA